MTFWTIFIIVIITIIVIIAIRNTNNPQRQLAALKDWFEGYPQKMYDDVQTSLLDSNSQRYDKNKSILGEKEHNERFNSRLIEYRENELWRMHVLTVLNRDNVSIETKKSVLSAWSDYILSLERLQGAIDIGYADSDEMDEMGDRIQSTRLSFIAIMSAVDFDLEKESLQIKSKVSKQYPVERKQKSISKNTK